MVTLRTETEPIWATSIGRSRLAVMGVTLMYRFMPRIVRITSFVGVALALAACGGHGNGVVPNGSAPNTTSMDAGVTAMAKGVPTPTPPPLATFTEYPVPTLNSTPNEIIKGPDGNVWFTELSGNRLGSIDALGHITESALLSGNSNSAPNGLNIGPDNAVWFTEDNVCVRDAVGRIATITGPISEWDGPSGIQSCSGPYDIITGLDANTLWFTESGTPNGVAAITTSGTVSTAWSGTPNTQYNQITKGPDGALWFTELNNDKIARIDSTKTVTELSAGITAGSGPYDIVTGPDGNLWFTEFFGGKIGRICIATSCPTHGAVTEFPTSSAGTGPNGITVGSDGNLYVAEYNTNAIARVTTAGTVTEFAIPTTALNGGNPGPAFLVTGSDGNLFVTEYNSNNILKVVPSLLGSVTPTPAPSPSPGACESDKDDAHQKPGHDNHDHEVNKPWKDCKTKKDPHHH